MSIRTAALLAGLAVVAAGCSQPVATSSPQRLDRPSDIAFGCIASGTGDAGTTFVAAVPLANCQATYTPPTPDAPPAGNGDAPPPPDAPPTPDASPRADAPAINFRTFAFVTEGVRGDVLVGNMDNTLFQDVDPFAPGLNGIPVGRLPVGIATVPNGCYAAVANAGSCDLALINITNAFNARPDSVRRLAVTSANGQPIAARPSDITALPTQAPGTPFPDCSTPQGSVYVAFGGCHLVARVDVATGRILDGIRYRDGAPPELVGPDVTCPTECVANGPDGGMVALDAPTPDAPVTVADARVAAGDGGATPDAPATAPQTEARPGVTALEPDGSRLYIGAIDSPNLLIVDLRDDGGLRPPRSLTLEGARGIRKITASGLVNMDTAGQYSWVYVIAQDNTIHVVDVTPGRDPRECDTQIDRRFLHDTERTDLLACFANGDPQNPPRRADATGPGIRLPQGVLPLDVGFVSQPRPAKASDEPAQLYAPSPLLGTFAVVTALGPIDDPTFGRGLIYYVTVKDLHYPPTEHFDLDKTPPVNVSPGNPKEPDIGLAISHSLRDASPARFNASFTACQEPTISDIWGAPRLTGNLTRPANYVYNDTATTADAQFAPSLHRVLCGDTSPTAIFAMSMGAPPAERAPLFPDLEKTAVRTVANGSSNEQIIVTWEGPLAAASADSRRSGARVNVEIGGMTVETPGALLCDLGVEKGDILTLIGCSTDRDCALGESCVVHPDAPAGSSGMCFPTERRTDLAALCAPILTSLRKYTVVEAADDHTVIVPRPSVLFATPIDGCTDPEGAPSPQCSAIEDKIIADAEAIAPAGTKFPHHNFACELDPTLGGPKRCVTTCTTDADCGTGALCETDTGRCILGPIPTPDCVSALQRYEYRAGDAFTLLSSQDEYRSREKVDPKTGMCVEDTSLSPLIVQRFHRIEPTCTDLSVTAMAPNPCVISGLIEPVPVSGGYMLRPAYGIRIRSVGVTVDITDVAIPFPNPDGDPLLANLRYSPISSDYTMAFQLAGGFQPFTNPLTAPLPSRVRVGPPARSLYVIDEGDQAGQLSTGQIIPIGAGGGVSVNRLH